MDPMDAEMQTVEPVEGTQNPDPTEGETAQVQALIARIRGDAEHHEPAFDRMRRDMEFARTGSNKEWVESGNYVANITGRHINQKVAALYAKNPKAVARRRERLDYALWDESIKTVMEAMQLAITAMQQPPDPATGLTPAMMDPGVQQAIELVKDYQQGTQARDQVERIGKTLEILFDYFTREQTPVDFKTSMKSLVRRAATTGVGYVKLGFQREYEQDPDVLQGLSDFTDQIKHVEYLMAQVQGGESDQMERQREELNAAMMSLQAQEYVLLREGLVFDFPDATKVIPDKRCRSLIGFIGARHLTVEYLFTPEEVEKHFGKKLHTGQYVGRHENGREQDATDAGKGGMVCVWEHYDHDAGVVYYLADGYPGYLKKPEAPDVYVEGFWPVFALTFNDVEHETELFPPSDVALIRDMQLDYNRSRQGKREHRQAARPRFLSRKGVLDEEDKANLSQAEPFSVTEVNAAEGDLASLVTPLQIPGVDPNLYETGETMRDVQLVIGAQEATLGGVAKATATESAIADDSRMSSVASNVDDLDAFLTRIAKASGQVLLREMSAEQVTEIVGPGSVWPQMTLDQIAKEIFLEVEAGSSGRPNQALEIKNWREMLPFLIQMPNISPEWLAKESLRRLDDRMDLTDALSEGIPSIVQMNQNAQPGPEDPGAAPDAQGAEGANQAPRGPEATEGTDAPMGNNRV